MSPRVKVKSERTRNMVRIPIRFHPSRRASSTLDSVRGTRPDISQARCSRCSLSTQPNLGTNTRSKNRMLEHSLVHIHQVPGCATKSRLRNTNFVLKKLFLCTLLLTVTMPVPVSGTSETITVKKIAKFVFTVHALVLGGQSGLPPTNQVTSTEYPMSSDNTKRRLQGDTSIVEPGHVTVTGKEPLAVEDPNILSNLDKNDPNVGESRQKTSVTYTAKDVPITLTENTCVKQIAAQWMPEHFYSGWYDYYFQNLFDNYEVGMCANYVVVGCFEKSETLIIASKKELQDLCPNAKYNDLGSDCDFRLNSMYTPWSTSCITSSMILCYAIGGTAGVCGVGFGVAWVRKKLKHKWRLIELRREALEAASEAAANHFKSQGDDLEPICAVRIPTPPSSILCAAQSKTV